MFQGFRRHDQRLLLVIIERQWHALARAVNAAATGMLRQTFFMPYSPWSRTLMGKTLPWSTCIVRTRCANTRPIAQFV